MVALRLEDREPATLSDVELASYAAAARDLLWQNSERRAYMAWRPCEHLLQVYTLPCMLL